MTSLLVAAVLLANGLGAGVMFSTVVGITPLTLTLPYPDYVRTIRFLWRRYDPFMPIANVAGLGADVALTLTADHPARLVFGLPAALLAMVIVISLFKNVPINKYVVSLDEERQPADWADRDPRRRWRLWNTVRTTLAVGAFLGNLTGVIILY